MDGTLSLKAIISNCFSLSDVLLAFNVCTHGRNTKWLREYCRVSDIDISHFDSGQHKNILYQRIRKVCPVCGKSFEALMGHKREKTTCSIRCGNTFFAHKKLTTICREKIAQTLRDNYDKRAKTKRVRELLSIECSFCKKVFYSKPKGKRTNKFCSNRCSIKHRWTLNGYRDKICSSIRERVLSGKHKGWTSRLGKKPSYAEKFFIKVLNNNKIEFEREKPVGKYFIDFAINDLRIALEIDGKQHNYPERKKKDLTKDAFLKENGWSVVRIQWKNLNNPVGKEYIRSEINKFLEFYSGCRGKVNSPALGAGQA